MKNFSGKTVALSPSGVPGSEGMRGRAGKRGRIQKGKERELVREKRVRGWERGMGKCFDTTRTILPELV